MSPQEMLNSMIATHPQIQNLIEDLDLVLVSEESTKDSD